MIIGQRQMSGPETAMQAAAKLSDSVLINREIRMCHERNTKFGRLTSEGRRRVIEIADGDPWRIEEIIDEVLDQERQRG